MMSFNRNTTMKFWIITAVASIGWLALTLIIFYFNMRANNAAFDDALGNICGTGFVAIWTIAFCKWFLQKQRNKHPRSAKE
jgi:hypothetical protein